MCSIKQPASWMQARFFGVPHQAGLEHSLCRELRKSFLSPHFLIFKYWLPVNIWRWIRQLIKQISLFAHICVYWQQLHGHKVSHNLYDTSPIGSAFRNTIIGKIRFHAKGPPIQELNKNWVRFSLSKQNLVLITIETQTPNGLHGT